MEKKKIITNILVSCILPYTSGFSIAAQLMEHSCSVQGGGSVTPVFQISNGAISFPRDSVFSFSSWGWMSDAPVVIADSQPVIQADITNMINAVSAAVSGVWRASIFVTYPTNYVYGEGDTPLGTSPVTSPLRNFNHNGVTRDLALTGTQTYGNYFTLTNTYKTSYSLLLNYVNALKLTFSKGSNYDSPVSEGSVMLPVYNEYSDRNITFRFGNLRAVLGPGAESQPGFLSASAQSQQTVVGSPNYIDIKCSRTATPLVLTLGANTIDFGILQLNGIPVTRLLTWSATGSGNARIWTLTFDSNTVEGDAILLGGAKVFILNMDGKIVSLGTPVDIHGITGGYKFSMEAKNALPGGPYIANVNITLSAK